MKKRNVVRFLALAIILFAGALFPLQTFAYSIGLVFADNPSSAPTTELLSHSSIDSVNTIDVRTYTPTLSELSGFDAVLAYTNYTPSDGVALGDILADYVDAGGYLVLATYGFSNAWRVDGRIMTTGYSPLTNLGTNGDVSGNLVATVPGDPIFNGVDLSLVTYFHNTNFAHPGLGTGATLLATDGTYNMIARNSTGNVLGLNLFPAVNYGNNDEFYKLLGNALVFDDSNRVPEPATMILFGTGLIVFAGLGRKKFLKR